MRATRARILAGLLLRTALRPAFRAALRGHPVRGGRLFFDNAYSLLRDRMWPHEARLLRGDLPRIRALRSQLYLQIEHQIALAPHAQTLARAGLADKGAFAEFCREEGLAAIPTLRVNAADATEWERAFAATASDCAFIKPARGSGGHGSALLQRTAAHSWRLTDASGVHEGELATVIRGHRSAGALVMQPLLTNHPELAAWAGSPLATFRTVTAQAGDGEVVVLSMLAEIPCGEERPIPKGWCIIPVDPLTGRLSSVDETAITALPPALRDRAAGLAGRTVPQAEGLAGLACAAHRRMIAAAPEPLPPMIGWDVALTAAGPVLVEPNWNWSVAAHYRNLAGLNLSLSDRFAAAAARR